LMMGRICFIFFFDEKDLHVDIFLCWQNVAYSLIKERTCFVKKICVYHFLFDASTLHILWWRGRIYFIFFGEKELYVSYFFNDEMYYIPQQRKIFITRTVKRHDLKASLWAENCPNFSFFLFGPGNLNYDKPRLWAGKTTARESFLWEIFVALC
jgi:hypothetical protein